MKAFLLLLVVPCLVIADTLCPDSDNSCPDDKRCCEVDGHHTCCDIDSDAVDVPIIEGKMKVYPGEPILEAAEGYSNVSMTVQQGVFDCLLSCNSRQKCCKNYYGQTWCCPLGSQAVCCTAEAKNKCCAYGMRCCPVGCCLKSQECCGGGCCKDNQRCCGAWCCKKKQQCGLSVNSPCYGKGFSFAPAITTVFLLAAIAVMSRHL